MYRGIRNPQSNILLGKSWDKRKPMDTPIVNQNMLDKKLKDAGFSALRSNSIFCTSDISFAGNYSYGYIYVIFQVDGFSYMWSSYIHDFYYQFVFWKNVGKLSEIENMPADKFVAEFGFENNRGMVGALKSKNEICISGAYVAIEVSSTSWDNIQELIGVSNDR